MSEKTRAAAAAVAHPWHTVAPSRGTVSLCLDAPFQDADPMDDLSAAVCTGDTLFLGSDEGLSIERLLRRGDGFVGHERHLLTEYLPFEGAGEADIEGLAEDDGWLWVVGSHARTRPKVTKGKGDEIDAAALSDLKDTRPRCLLARLPLVAAPDEQGGLIPAARDGIRRAGMLKPTKSGNAIAKALANDPVIGPFTRIAAKEGGVDVEGIAVAGSRVALGLRGPTIRGHALLLEMEVSAKRSGALRLASPPLKRLVALDGLGIRDLKRLGADLLILAGPTSDLDGPCAIYRWRGWLHDAAAHDGAVRLHRPELMLDLPFGRGDDHPEGLALLPRTDGTSDLLVICDGPAAHRVDRRLRTVGCDLFAVAP